jgi:hypothetical protein
LRPFHPCGCDRQVCWEGGHALLATAALIAYAFYVPLSIMITPMLLEAPRKDEGSAGGTVTYLKLYLMSINVIKSVMLLVAVMGPQRIATAVVSSIVASFLLGTLTYVWFQAQDLIAAHYSAELQPCNIAFINYWKAASYSAAVASAIVLVTAHALNENTFSPQELTETLVASWIIIILVFAALYYRYHKQISSRRQVVDELISYPFELRDNKEKLSSGNSSAPPAATVVYSSPNSMRMHAKSNKIPGSEVSPWFDQRHKLSYARGYSIGNDSLSQNLINRKAGRNNKQ